MKRPPRLFNTRPPRPRNTYIWARWSELHRVVRALAKVCTTFNWLIADAPPKSIHAIAVYLRSEYCRTQWPVSAEYADDATPPVTAAPDTHRRLISLAQHLCETDHADLLSRALPDCPATMFPILDRCGETVQAPEFYVALSRAIREGWTSPFFHRSASIDTDLLRTLERVRSLDPMLHAPVAEDRIHLHLAEALNTLLQYMRHKHPGEVDVIFNDALTRWRPNKFKPQLDSLLTWLPPPNAPWEGDDMLKPLASAAALARASRKYSNCLKKHLLDFSCGRMAFYEWDDPAEPVIISLESQPPLYWNISLMRGIKNAIVNDATCTEIELRLSKAGIGTGQTLSNALEVLRTQAD